MGDLESALSGVESVLSGKSMTPLAALFAPSFLAQVPIAHLESIFGRIHSEIGLCSGREILERPTEHSARVRWRFERGYVIEGTVGVAEGSGAIVFMNFGLPSRPTDSWNDLRTAIANLPGATSFELRELQGGRVLADHAAERALGVGSSSKLAIFAAVLDAVASGSRRWEDLLRLASRNRSLPSGIMHTWPEGSPLTLHTAAVLLVSLSDNTAADLLLAELGRDRVEASLDGAGVGKHPMLRPFLSTRAIFGLVSADAELRRRYREADRDGRLALIAQAEHAPPLIEKLSSEAWPAEFDWMLSAHEMNDLLAHLAVQIDRDPVGRGVFGMNLEQIASHDWRFVGFKGGSSPGRLCLAALLESGERQRVAVTLVNNVPPAELKVDVVAMLFRRATDLALSACAEAH
jgi:hypothetical protein